METSCSLSPARTKNKKGNELQLPHEWFKHKIIWANEDIGLGISYRGDQSLSSRLLQKAKKPVFLGRSGVILSTGRAVERSKQCPMSYQPCESMISFANIQGFCPQSLSLSIIDFLTLAFAELRGKREGMQGMRKGKRNWLIFHERRREKLQITKSRPLVTVNL